MSTLRREITYFTSPGPNNSERTLALAKERADSLGLHTVIVASTTGETGLAAARLFKDYHVVVVTHSAGFHQPNTQEMPAERISAIRAEGATVLTCQHAFGGVGRAVRIKLGTYELEEIIAYTLRIFSEGIKVAVESTIMATDAGLAHTGESVMAIAGTGRGADTAVILQAANAMRFFDLNVLEIVCMPGGCEAQ
ncbi:MAG: pyruvate kinase alpha/beta domain-containing protein [Anaerolineae bacterium]